MGAAHSHDHHCHGYERHYGQDSTAHRKRLAMTLGLVVVYMGAEIAGGILSGSLALLADAGHMFSDAAALALTFFAMWMAQRPPDSVRTYGYHRMEILAALANGAALLCIAAFVAKEAVERLSDPPEVKGGLMMGIACGGLLVNLLGLLVLHGSSRDNLNMRGAFLHVAADALGSVGAIVSGLLILTLDWRWADPAAGLAIAALVVFSAWRLLKDTVGVLMESAPGHLDVDEISAAMGVLPGVVGVHDLHVWTITSGLESLSGHVVVSTVCHREVLLSTIRDLLHERFGIDHITIQIEPEGFEEQGVSCG